MTTKKTTATTEKKTTPRRVHVVPEPEPKPVAEREVELDEAAPESGEAPAAEAPPEPEKPMTAEEKNLAARRVRQAHSKKVRAFKSAIKRLGAFDPEDPDMSGLAGAMSFLKGIADRLSAKKASAAKATSSFAVGDTVRIREKVVAKFDGIIARSDALSVVAIVGKHVKAKLSTGETVVLSRNDVEAAS